MQRSSLMAFAIAAIGGGTLWLATSFASGRIEAWDSRLYWTISYPASILLSGLLGYWFPRQAWRWGVTVMFAQLVVMLLRGSGFSLLPLGLMLFAVLVLPAVGLAELLARMRPRNSRQG